jgi:serine/threonine protein kinase
MGAVYLARQMSLDRDVALKVLSPRLSGHPSLVSRFMREAYAAGQLVHHNVVQIYDFGRDKPRRTDRVAVATSDGAAVDPGLKEADADVHFFSMEFVDGASLQNLVRDRGRLEPQEAVSLLLQAARGLAFAHEHGIIHRDIKPDNLMLNRQGILKVADLGLVKQIGATSSAPPAAANGDTDPIEPAALTETESLSSAASAQITQVSQMMGTPAYMPPEQATDAKSADARADIYSLGCTLYHLVVGHPPFGGRTLQEVLEAHRTEKVRFPDPMEGGPKISTRLKEIIRRMCAKGPQERFSSMQRVVRELEEYLADKHQLGSEPTEQQVKTLEWSAQQFYASSWMRMRPMIIVSFVVVLLAGIVTTGLVFEDPLTAFGAIGGLIGMAVLTFAFSFILGGRRRRDVLYTKSRELVFGAGLSDYVIAGLALGLLVVALLNLGWGWWWLGAAAIALALAWVWQGIVDKGVHDDHQPIISRAERVLKEMRESGIGEPRVRRAVAEAGGRHWEGLYEALFGYEAKLDARQTYGVDEKGREKPRFAPWRDPILSWLNERLEQRRMKRDHKLLRGLHRNELLAQGIKADIADRAAVNQARREIGKAALLREQIVAELRRELRREMFEKQTAPEDRPADAAEPEAEAESDPAKKERRSRKIRYTDDDFERIHESYFKRRFGTPLDMLLGQQLRFAIAAVLLLCFTLWFSQNQEAIFGLNEAFAVDVNANPDETITAGGSNVRGEIDASAWWKRMWTAGEPVELLGLDPAVTKWVSGFRVGVAGLLMILGAFFYGRLLSLANIVSMLLIIVVAPFLGANAWIVVLAGVAVWGLGLFFLRVSED